MFFISAACGPKFTAGTLRQPAGLADLRAAWKSACTAGCAGVWLCTRTLYLARFAVQLYYEYCTLCLATTRSSRFAVHPVRTREYDFKSFIKRIVSGSTLGRLHNTMGIYIHGSGHKLSMWYHVVLGHPAISLLVLITL
eukprot:COSAG01_NODE_3601_length_5888_cov_506.113146_7_plen_139_part_00